MKSKVLSSVCLLAGLSLMLGSCLNDDSITPYQQLQEDIAKIDAYLEANPPVDPTDIIVKDASGIRMVITEQPVLEEGDALPVPPTPQNLIRVKYAGRLFSNGAQFDADDSYTFTLTTDDNGGQDVIEGWKSALRMMTEGTKATVYIPSALAYGTSGKSPIPGNAILVFDLELLVVDTEDEAAQRLIDSGKINAALEAVPNVVNDPSGISYILEPIGTGSIPGLYDQVRVRITGRVLDGDIFVDNVEQGPVNVFSSRVVNYIHGLTVGLQHMREGDKAKIYVPSSMGYGPSSVTVAANSVLVFDIELLEVIPNQE